MARSVLNEPLVVCSTRPVTGWYRNGMCQTGRSDFGLHCVCCVMTSEFLAYSKSQGNDLVTPLPVYDFPGLLPGDRWCVCVTRWKAAYEAGVAPPVVLESTHIAALEFVDIEVLEQCAVKNNAS